MVGSNGTISCSTHLNRRSNTTIVLSATIRGAALTSQHCRHRLSSSFTLVLSSHEIISLVGGTNNEYANFRICINARGKERIVVDTANRYCIAADYFGDGNVETFP